MKERILAACLSGVAYCSVVLGLPTPMPREKLPLNYTNTPIRVLLEKGIQRATFQILQGPAFVKIGPNAKWQKFHRKLVIGFQLVNGHKRLTVNHKQILSEEIYIRPRYRTTPIRFQENSYFGEIRVHNEGGQVLVVNVVPIEEYLEGTLEGETIASWNIEALKAQAVASRSYALYMIRHPKHPFYDLQNTVQDQVYKGRGSQSPKIKEAVRETEGIILHTKGQPVKAFYHARCGGMTETARAVWQIKKDPHQKRVVCPYCQKNRYVWQSEFSHEWVAKRLALAPQNPSLRIAAAQRSPSGRVMDLLFEADGEKRQVEGEALRRFLGFADLKSTNFNWKNGEHSVTFYGVGMGHGVGMCQWGAGSLAKQGKGYRQILAYYYPDVEISGSSKTP